MLSQFPLVRYRFSFKIDTPLYLPDYAGSTLRGAFGGALRRVACMTREPECKSCGLYRSCPYPQIFETPPPELHLLQKFSQIPNPYVIEPPSWGERTYQRGETLQFNFVVAGRARQQLPFIVLAWQRAFQRGVGRGGGTATLMLIEHLTQREAIPIYSIEQPSLVEHETLLRLPEMAETSTVTLNIETPLRLQDNGKPLGPDKLQSRDLLIGLLRRIALISEFHTGLVLPIDFAGLAKQAEAVRGEKELRWLDWTRYSNRQQQKMSLGGVVGRWRLHGNIAPFMPSLYFGQWLHVGKNATFGMGSYCLTEAKNQQYDGNNI